MRAMSGDAMRATLRAAPASEGNSEELPPALANGRIAMGRLAAGR
jgi:hypothetical protein